MVTRGAVPVLLRSIEQAANLILTVVGVAVGVVMLSLLLRVLVAALQLDVGEVLDGVIVIAVLSWPAKKLIARAVRQRW